MAVSAADRFVLDASVALAWFFPDSADSTGYAISVAELIAKTAAVCVVPHMFNVEIGSALVRKHRDRAARFRRNDLQSAIATVVGLTLDVADRSETCDDIVRLAQVYNLQGYDALYFHLARERALPIATLDRGIRSACRRFEVELLEP